MKKKYYDRMAIKAKRALEKCPKEGVLRVDYRNGKPQYYLITEAGDTTGRYLKKKEHNIARSLAQRDYNKKVLSCAEEWSRWLDKVIRGYPKEDLKDIYRKSERRKDLIFPYEITDEEFVRKWETVEYEGKGFQGDTVEIYTEKGERVRSKSEKIIADQLYMMGIPYRYEYPFIFESGRIVYPDFTMLDVKSRKEILLEHFGMMDDENYRDHMILKLNEYIRNGINAGDRIIFTWESKAVPLDTVVLKKLLSGIFLD